jgi:hypothetical protein
VLGHTVDVGPGGCHVVTDRAYDISSDPTVTLKMPDGAQVVALARVVGASRDNRGSHHYRLVFAALEANDARVITKLVERGLTKLNS